jgi:uncharacterized metal-binding protein
LISSENLSSENLSSENLSFCRFSEEIFSEEIQNQTLLEEINIFQKNSRQLARSGRAWIVLPVLSSRTRHE